MSDTPAQLTFDLAPRPALGAEDFLVSPANEAALGWIERWPDWSHHALVLEGPAQAGKTHLGQVWRLASGAAQVASADLSEASVAALKSARALLIENLENGIGDERVLFHLLNAAREQQCSLLLTTRVPVASMAIALPDLGSRLRAVPIATIAPPDEALLKAVLVKHFADRQLAVEPAVISALALRIERSMAMAEAVVAAIDRRALAMKRKVTRVLAMEALAELGQPSDDETQPSATTKPAGDPNGR
jgi:chromosomal replication initiation ATPase DnaA